MNKLMDDGNRNGKWEYQNPTFIDGCSVFPYYSVPTNQHESTDTSRTEPRGHGTGEWKRTAGTEPQICRNRTENHSYIILMRFAVYCLIFEPMQIDANDGNPDIRGTMGAQKLCNFLPQWIDRHGHGTIRFSSHLVALLMFFVTFHRKCAGKSIWTLCEG